jgi:hypothetical protein
MVLLDTTLALVSKKNTPCDAVSFVSMLQFLISTPVTLKAETALEPLPVVVILNPAQSRTTLFDPAPFRLRAVEGQFMSVSSVVLAVNIVPQAGVTA